VSYNAKLHPPSVSCSGATLMPFRSCRTLQELARTSSLVAVAAPPPCTVSSAPFCRYPCSVRSGVPYLAGRTLGSSSKLSVETHSPTLRCVLAAGHATSTVESAHRALGLRSSRALWSWATGQAMPRHYWPRPAGCARSVRAGPCAWNRPSGRVLK
jgi:hypothetical protein